MALQKRTRDITSRHEKKGEWRLHGKDIFQQLKMFRNRWLPCTSLESQVCHFGPSLYSHQVIFTSLTILPPLGLISNLWATSLGPFTSCASGFLVTLEKGRALYWLAHYKSQSAHRIPALFVSWQHLYLVHRDSPILWLLDFFFLLHSTERNLLYVMTQDTHSYTFNFNKIWWNKVYSYKI